MGDTYRALYINRRSIRKILKEPKTVKTTIKTTIKTTTIKTTTVKTALVMEMVMDMAMDMATTATRSIVTHYKHLLLIR